MLTVKYRDLKNDITLVVSFEDYNDMIIFFNKYNPLSIDILDIINDLE